MISIQKVKDDERFCNACRSRDSSNVRKLSIGNGQNVIAIYLCDKCRKELAEALRREE